MTHYQRNKRGSLSICFVFRNKWTYADFRPETTWSVFFLVFRVFRKWCVFRGIKVGRSGGLILQQCLPVVHGLSLKRHRRGLCMIYPDSVYSFHPTTWIFSSTVPPFFSWETKSDQRQRFQLVLLGIFITCHVSRDVDAAILYGTQLTGTQRALLVEMFKKTYTNYKSHWTNIIAHRKYILSYTNCQEPTSWFCRTVHLNEKQVPDGSTLTRGGRHFSAGRIKLRATATQHKTTPYALQQPQEPAKISTKIAQHSSQSAANARKCTAAQKSETFT